MNSGGQDVTSQEVIVTEASGNSITMDIWSATLNRKGRLTVQLNWNNTTGNNVNIIRNGVLIATTANDGTYKDVSTNMPSDTYTYQVCETNGGNCSPEKSVNL